MNFTLYILTILLFLPVSSLDSIREAYFSGAKTEESALAFNAMMGESRLVTNTHKAYYGASLALKAKYGQNVKEKKEFFIEAVDYIESAVNADPENIEIRLIRLSVQENSPRIVKYKTNMDEDKTLIIQNYSVQTSAVKKCIRDYVANSEFFTIEEKEPILN